MENQECKVSKDGFEKVNKASRIKRSYGEKANSPFSEDKVIQFINHLIETSLNEDVKKNLIRYKNSMMINSKLQLTMKKLETFKKICKKYGINRRKAIGLTAYFN